jgi:dTDP-4-amino-4,6-dideoxygalactose transaminase
VTEALASGWLGIEGKFTKQFEAKLAEMAGVKCAR